MANLTLRSVKGAALTFNEMDSNFSSLNNGLIDSASWTNYTITLSKIGEPNLTIDISSIFNDSASFASELNVAGDFKTGGTLRLDNAGVLTNVTTATASTGTSDTTLATTEFVANTLQTNVSEAKLLFYSSL